MYEEALVLSDRNNVMLWKRNCNKMAFALVFIKPSAVVVGLYKFHPHSTPLSLRLSSALKLHIVYCPYNNSKESECCYWRTLANMD